MTPAPDAKRPLDAVSAWASGAEDAASRIEGLPEPLRSTALARLGYSTAAHREVLGL